MGPVRNMMIPEPKTPSPEEMRPVPVNSMELHDLMCLLLIGPDCGFIGVAHIGDFMRFGTV